MEPQVHGRLTPTIDASCEHVVTNSTNLHSGQNPRCRYGAARCIQIRFEHVRISTAEPQIAASAQCMLQQWNNSTEFVRASHEPGQNHALAAREPVPSKQTRRRQVTLGSDGLLETVRAAPEKVRARLSPVRQQPSKTHGG
jgi:hypothetical protein